MSRGVVLSSAPGRGPRPVSWWAVSAVAAWVLGGAAMVGADPPAAVVNGVPLEQWEVDRELALSISTGSFHGSLPDDRMDELVCASKARLVLKELKWQWAQRNGMEGDPARVQASWQEIRSRFNSDHQYRAALSMKGISDAGLRRAMQRDAAAEAVNAAVVAGLSPPTEIEVSVYFTLHQDDYMSPESRHVVHALVHVPPSASREAWQRAERQARELAREVAQDGIPLIDAAAPLLERLPPRFRHQVGDIGLVHRGSLLPAVDQAVFAVAPGSVTEPVRSIYGFHVLQVIGARPPRPLELAEVREAVAENLLRKQRERRLQAFERELQDSAVVEVGGCAGTS